MYLLLNFAQSAFNFILLRFLGSLQLHCTDKNNLNYAIRGPDHVPCLSEIHQSVQWNQQCRRTGGITRVIYHPNEVTWLQQCNSKVRLDREC